MARSAEQVIHDSLQEWNAEEFVEMDWNNKAASAIVKALNEAGYIVVMDDARSRRVEK